MTKRSVFMRGYEKEFGFYFSLDFGTNPKVWIWYEEPVQQDFIEAVWNWNWSL